MPAWRPGHASGRNDRQTDGQRLKTRRSSSMRSNAMQCNATQSTSITITIIIISLFIGSSAYHPAPCRAASETRDRWFPSEKTAAD